LVVGVFALYLVGCSGGKMASPTSSSPSTSGNVQVVLNLGKVGLAKTASVTPINLDSCVMSLSATGEVPVHVVIPLSGNGQTVVSQTFNLAPKVWSLTVSTYAMHYYSGMMGYGYPQVIHQGMTNFTVVAGTNPTVSLSISSQYSMLLLRISPVPDSCNEVTLYSGDSLNGMYSSLADTTFGVGIIKNADTVKILYDWLNVSTYSQHFQATVRGIWNGASMVLYWGNFQIPHVTAGADTSYSFNMNWQGPSTTLASQSISVNVGAIGLIVVDGKPIKQ